MSNTKQLRLAGKVALITGACGGIGTEAAKIFAQNGASLMLTDLDEGRLATLADSLRDEGYLQAGAKVSFAAGDVASGASVSAVAAKAEADLGPVTVLLNNAGITNGDLLQMHEVKDEDFDRIMAVNLKGPFLFCKYILPQMMRAGHGSVVNIASAAALGMAPRAVYAASKGGVATMTRSIAFQYGKFGIRANAICPGPVDTPMSRAARASGMYKEMIVQSLVDRRANPEEMANIALFLASDEASFISGDLIAADGGALRLRKELFA